MKKRTIPLALLALLCGSARSQDVSPIVSEGIVEAPLNEVWAAWATSEGLRSWLAPHADIDLRIGGRMRTNYRAEGTLDDPQTIENVVLSFEPRRMISMKVSKAPEGFPFPNAIQQMWTVIYFEASGAERTQVRAVSLGFGLDEESQKMRAFFNRGNASTLKELQHHFSGARR